VQNLFRQQELRLPLKQKAVVNKAYCAPDLVAIRPIYARKVDVELFATGHYARWWEVCYRQV